MFSQVGRVFRHSNFWFLREHYRASMSRKSITNSRRRVRTQQAFQFARYRTAADRSTVTYFSRLFNLLVNDNKNDRSRVLSKKDYFNSKIVSSRRVRLSFSAL